MGVHVTQNRKRWTKEMKKKMWAMIRAERQPEGDGKVDRVFLKFWTRQRQRMLAPT